MGEEFGGEEACGPGACGQNAWDIHSWGALGSARRGGAGPESGRWGSGTGVTGLGLSPGSASGFQEHLVNGDERAF